MLHSGKRWQDGSPSCLGTNWTVLIGATSRFVEFWRRGTWGTDHVILSPMPVIVE